MKLGWVVGTFSAGLGEALLVLKRAGPTGLRWLLEGRLQGDGCCGADEEGPVQADG